MLIEQKCNIEIVAKNKMFEKVAFQKEVKENVKNLYRKTMEEADPQEIFQAVSLAVKDVAPATTSAS